MKKTYIHFLVTILCVTAFFPISSAHANVFEDLSSWIQTSFFGPQSLGGAGFKTDKKKVLNTSKSVRVLRKQPQSQTETNSTHSSAPASTTTIIPVSTPSSHTTVHQTTVISCSDSDGGKNFLQKGSVVWKIGNRSKRFTDETSTNGIIEYSCDRYAVRGDYIPCEYGVSNGACITTWTCPQPVCVALPSSNCSHIPTTDSDNGCVNPCGDIVCKEKVICPKYIQDPNFCLDGTVEKTIKADGCYQYKCVRKETTASCYAAALPTWATEAISQLTSFGAIDSLDAINCHPNEKVLRSELAKMTVLFSGADFDTSGGPHFSDVTMANRAYKYAETFYNYKWIDGISDGKFFPEKEISRTQAIKIVSTAFKIDANRFKTVASPDSLYLYVNDGTHNVTRMEAARILFDSQLVLIESINNSYRTTPQETTLQEIDLSAGWNIISLFVTPQDNSIEAVFDDLIQEGSLLRVKNLTASFDPNVPIHLNTLKEIEKGMGYQVKVSRNATLRLSGDKIYLPYTHHLDTGWNMIGYPSDKELDAECILSPLKGDPELKMQDESGSAFEDWGIFGGWTNNIGNMKPGEGYKVLVSSPRELTIATTCTVQEELSMSVEGIDLSETSIVGGSTDASFFKFSLKNNGNVNMNVNNIELVAKGTGNAAMLSNFTGVIFIDGTQHGSSQFISSSNNSLRFSEIAVILSEGTQKEFIVVLDTIQASAPGTLQLSLSEVTTSTEGGMLAPVFNGTKHLSSTNPIVGQIFEITEGGKLTVSLDATVYSDVLVSNQKNVEILKVRLLAQNEDVLVKDLYFENDLNNDEIPDNTDAGEVLKFKLYNSSGQLIQENAMASGYLHFGLANQDRIVVPKDGHTFVTIKVDILDINRANQIGKKLQISLDGNHETKGLETVSSSTGYEINPPSSGWETGNGAVTGQPFIIYKTKASLGHASSQPTINMPSLASTEFYRFTVTADSAGRIDVGKVMMNVSLNGFSFSGPANFSTQKVINGSPDNNQTFVTTPTNNTVDGSTSARLSVDLSGERLSAGEPRTYAVFTDSTKEVGTAENSDGLTVTLLKDTSYTEPTTKSSRQSASFLWSDESDPSHSDNTSDWMSGYLLDIDTNGKRITK